MRRPAVLVGLIVLLFTAAPVVGDAGPLGLLDNGESGRGSFSSLCRYSHRLAEDPIVAPGKPGGSHSHDFFGNVSTNAFSTYSSMLAAGTTCRRSEDTAGYWIPTLFANGRAVQPMGISAYYQSLAKNPGSIRPFPADLRVIAGNSSAGPPSASATYWDCGQRGPMAPSSTARSCPGGRELRLHILFPNCWNGTTVDSPDHRSHMAYAKAGECPESHPVSVPRLRLNVVYPIQGGSSLTLSSGSTATAHADFFNTWKQSELERLVRVCNQTGRNCGSGGA
jgi:hypothetical protein